jgi:hypothetical protein
MIMSVCDDGSSNGTHRETGNEKNESGFGLGSFGELLQGSPKYPDDFLFSL